MDIRIAVEDTEPLAGRASVDGVDAQPFVGWLELLRVLSRLVEPDREVPSA